MSISTMGWGEECSLSRRESLCRYHKQPQKHLSLGCTNFAQKYARLMVPTIHHVSIQHYLMGIQLYIRVSNQSQINVFTDSTFISLFLLAVLCTKPRPWQTKIKTSYGSWSYLILSVRKDYSTAYSFWTERTFACVEESNIAISRFAAAVRSCEAQAQTVVCYTYTEHVSKNRVGVLKQIRFWTL